MENKLPPSKEYLIKFYKQRKEVRVYPTPRKVRIMNFVFPYLKKDNTLLDVGFGNGHLTRQMAFFTEVVGIDLQVDICIEQDLGQYDVVTCFDILEHVLDLDAALKNVKRATKPDGLVIINQPEMADPKQPHDVIRTPDEIIHKIGLKLIRLQWYKTTKFETYNFMVFRCPK